MSVENVIAAEVYMDLRRGDPIKDGELAIAISVFEDMVETTVLMGQRFDLFTVELNSTLNTLIGFRDFRRKDK